MEIKTKFMKKAMFLIVFTIFIWWLFKNFEFVGTGLNLFLGVLAPFIIGLGIAFILNKPMKLIEKKLFGENAPFSGLKDNYKRPISFLMTLILFILIIAIVLTLIIPNLIGAGEQLADKIPKYFEETQEYIKNSSTKYPEINNQLQKIDFGDIGNSLLAFVKGGFSNWIGSTVTVFSSVVGNVVSTGLGFVFAVYFLLQKEDLIISIKKLIYAVLPLNVANRIFYIGKMTRESFSEF